MNYEQKYKEALERARKELQEYVHKDCDDMTRRTAINIIHNLFPELAESEDERIRKGLIKAFGTIGKKDWGGLIVRDILAWLEKQGKSSDKAEPKFKVGDKVVTKRFKTDVKTIEKVSQCGTYWTSSKGHYSGWWGEDELEPYVEHKMLNADKVIEWLKQYNISDCDVRTSIIPDSSPTSIPHRVRWLSDDFINKFKKDFGL